MEKKRGMDLFDMRAIYPKSMTVQPGKFRAFWQNSSYHRIYLSLLHSGRLRQVLENWQTPPADVYAVYSQRLQTAARVKAFVDHVVDAFATTSSAKAENARNPSCARSSRFWNASTSKFVLSAHIRVQNFQGVHHTWAFFPSCARWSANFAAKKSRNSRTLEDK